MTRGSLETWLHKKGSHKLKTLNSASLQKLSSMTDQDNFVKLLNPMMRVRVSGTKANEEVQEYIKSVMKSYRWSIEEDFFEDDTPLGKKNFNNIIATQNPSAPRTLTIACHFDSKYFKDFEFIGATDSAVPCAMMLDLARAFNGLWETQKIQDVSLQFIFFDGEEAFHQWSSKDSIYGARHLASKMAAADKRVSRDLTVKEIETMDALILLDLIGTKTVKFSNFFSSTNNLFQRLQKLEKKMAKSNLLELPGEGSGEHSSNRYFVGGLRSRSGIEDDHIPFMQRGVSILHLISVPFPHEWHTIEDNASCLHFPTIHNLNSILRAFVAEYLHLVV